MDRLDTELTVGQIQGKYQLKLVYGSGHSLHEDQPAEVAKHILTFAYHFGIFSGTHAAHTDEQAELKAKLARARNTSKSNSNSSSTNGSSSNNNNSGSNRSSSITASKVSDSSSASNDSTSTAKQQSASQQKAANT
jgi:hypothetical protein